MRPETFLALLCLIVVAKSDDKLDKVDIDKLLETIVKIAVKALEKSLNKLDNIKIIRKPQHFDVTAGKILEGSLAFNEVKFYGLKGLSLPMNFSSHLAEKTLSFSLDVAATSEIGFKVKNYTADVGVINSLPLYGKNGHIWLAMRKLKFKISTDVSWDKSGIFLNNFRLKPSFYLAKVAITQFFNNPEFSTAISDVMSLLVDAGLVVWYAEEHCISCVVSTIIETVINKSSTIWDNIVSHCKGVCLPSQSTFVSAAFQTDLTNLSERDLINYIEIAAGKFIRFAENHLGI